MVYRRRRILLSEIERQCGIALLAYDEAAAALQKHHADRFWASLQALTTAAAHLNALLWPAPDASIAWAVELRNTLDIQLDSPIRDPGLPASLDLVSALENWQNGNLDRPWHASNFGPNGFTAALSRDCIRYFDRQNALYVFCGHLFELPTLLGAIAGLCHRTRMEIEHLRELV